MPSEMEWSAEEMRRLGHAVVDAVVDRHAGLRESEPWRGGSRAETEALLREPCPEEGRDPDQVLARALSDILPRAGRIDHPRFMAFVGNSPVWASILGDWLASGFNIFQGTWLESAAPSQVELVVLEWFREWMGLPDGASGLFTSGGSAANLIAVVAARVRAGDPDRPVAYLSGQAHSSVGRALRIAGFPEDGIRAIPVGPDLRMRVDLLQEAVTADVEAGRTPVLVSANGGATNTGIVDPLPQLAAVAREADAWFHVDAAYGGFARLTPRGRTLLAGIEEADSVTLDPHKWLFQTYEAGCLLVRDPADLNRAFRVIPEYLQDTDLGLEHVNFADRGLQLTRSFRALKVWTTVQMHGRRALAEAVDAGMTLADHAARRVRREPGLQLLGEPGMSIVCFRAVPAAGQAGTDGPDAATPASEVPPDPGLDDWNRWIQDRIVEEGTAMMSSTRIYGHFALRICTVSHRVEQADLDAVLDGIVSLASRGPDPVGGGPPT